MSWLWLSGAEAERKAQINKACKIIEEREKERLEKQKKSYPIDSRPFELPDEEEQGFFDERPFGRG